MRDPGRSARRRGCGSEPRIGPPQAGIALFDDGGAALSGDFTSDLHFYDVGTEIDEEPAVGAHTGPNQATPEEGAADAVGTVRVLSATRYAQSGRVAPLADDHRRRALSGDQSTTTRAPRPPRLF